MCATKMKISTKKEGDIGSRWGSDKGMRQREVQGDNCAVGLQNSQPRVGRGTDVSRNRMECSFQEKNGTDGSAVVFDHVESGSQRTIAILLQSLGRIRDGDLEKEIK